MEEGYRDSRSWEGVVDEYLGSQYYIDMIDHANESILDSKCRELYEKIINECSSEVVESGGSAGTVHDRGEKKNNNQLKEVVTSY